MSSKFKPKKRSPRPHDHGERATTPTADEPLRSTHGRATPRREVGRPGDWLAAHHTLFVDELQRQMSAKFINEKRTVLSVCGPAARKAIQADGWPGKTG